MRDHVSHPYRIAAESLQFCIADLTDWESSIPFFWLELGNIKIHVMCFLLQNFTLVPTPSTSPCRSRWSLQPFTKFLAIRTITLRNVIKSRLFANFQPSPVMRGALFTARRTVATGNDV